MGFLTHGLAALAVVYGLSHGCSQLKYSLFPPPYIPGSPVEESKEYTVWKGNEKMTLPGYELKRRPYDMSIDEFIESQKVIAQKQ